MELNVLSGDGPVLHVGVEGAVSMAALAEQSESRAAQGSGVQNGGLVEPCERRADRLGVMSWRVVQHKRFCDAGRV